MLVSKATGETQLDGTDYRLIFTAEAWEAAETQLGRSAFTLVQDAGTGRIGFRELRVLLGVSIEAHRRRNGAHGKPFNPARVPKIIEQAGGLMPVVQQVTQAMVLSTALGANDATDDDDDDEGDEPTEASPFAGTSSSGDLPVLGSLPTERGA